MNLVQCSTTDLLRIFLSFFFLSPVLFLKRMKKEEIVKKEDMISSPFHNLNRKLIYKKLSVKIQFVCMLFFRKVSTISSEISLNF